MQRGARQRRLTYNNNNSCEKKMKYIYIYIYIYIEEATQLCLVTSYLWIRRVVELLEAKRGSQIALITAPPPSSLCEEIIMDQKEKEV